MGEQNATCILSTDMIYYLNQFGWHCEADRTVCLPPSHLRSGINRLAAGNIQMDILQAIKTRSERIDRLEHAFVNTEFKGREIILTNLLSTVLTVFTLWQSSRQKRKDNQFGTFRRPSTRYYC